MSNLTIPEASYGFLSLISNVALTPETKHFIPPLTSTPFRNSQKRPKLVQPDSEAYVVSSTDSSSPIVNGENGFNKSAFELVSTSEQIEIGKCFNFNFEFFIPKYLIKYSESVDPVIWKCYEYIKKMEPVVRFSQKEVFCTRETFSNEILFHSFGTSFKMPEAVQNNNVNDDDFKYYYNGVEMCFRSSEYGVQAIQ